MFTRHVGKKLGLLGLGLSLLVGCGGTEEQAVRQAATTTTWTSNAGCKSDDYCFAGRVAEGKRSGNLIRILSANDGDKRVNDIYVSYVNDYGDGFSTTRKWFDGSSWNTLPCDVANDYCYFGDFDGDGLQDILSIPVNFSSKMMKTPYISKSSGSADYGFESATVVSYDYSPACDPTSEVCRFVDINQDGKADLVAFDSAGNVFAALSDGYTFGARQKYMNNFCTPTGKTNGTDICLLGNFRYNDGNANGNSWLNLVRIETNGKEASFHVALVDETNHYTEYFHFEKNVSMANSDSRFGVGNFLDNEGGQYQEIMEFAQDNRANAKLWVVDETSSENLSMNMTRVERNFCVDENRCRIADMDGDGYDDIISLYPNGQVDVALAGSGGWPLPENYGD